MPLGASRPWETFAMKFTLLDRSNGIENVLGISDVCMRYAWTIPTKDQEAITLAKVLVKQTFDKFGPPERLLTDQGCNPTNALMQQLCRMHSRAWKKSRRFPSTRRGMEWLDGLTGRCMSCLLPGENKELSRACVRSKSTVQHHSTCHDGHVTLSAVRKGAEVTGPPVKHHGVGVRTGADQ